MGMLTDDMQRVVREQRLGFVATVCPDGTPNLSPKGTLTVWDDEHLVFADIRSPATMRNLRINPAVEINVVDPIARKGYRFKGTATVVDRGQLKEDVREFYSSRWIDTGKGQSSSRWKRPCPWSPLPMTTPGPPKRRSAPPGGSTTRASSQEPKRTADPRARSALNCWAERCVSGLN